MFFPDSIWNLVKNPRQSAQEKVVERIRLAMLKALDDYCDADHLRVDEAIRRAKDVAALWYVRPDLMRAIASCREQTVAQQVLQEITKLFHGHYSAARSSRPGA
jgi:hypothetical protein